MQGGRRGNCSSSWLRAPGSYCRLTCKWCSRGTRSKSGRRSSARSAARTRSTRPCRPIPPSTDLWLYLFHLFLIRQAHRELSDQFRWHGIQVGLFPDALERERARRQIVRQHSLVAGQGVGAAGEQESAGLGGALQTLSLVDLWPDHRVVPEEFGP